MLPLTGHSGQVTAVAFSPDGRWLASAGWDGTVRLWERPSYEMRRCLRTPYDHVTALDFANGGEFLAIAFRNHDSTLDPRGYGTLAWTTVCPRAGRDLNLLPMHETWSVSSYPTRLMRIEPQSQQMVIAGLQGSVQFVDPQTRSVVHSLSIPQRTLVLSLAVAPNGSGMVATTTMQARTSTILIWAGDGITHHIPVTRAIAQCLAFSPDANQLYVGLDSGHLMWWPAGPTGSPQSALLTHGGSVDLAVAPDNRSLLLAGNDGYVQLWDVGARQVRQTYDWQIGTISRVAFAPDGLTAAAAGDGVVMVWDIDS